MPDRLIPSILAADRHSLAGDRLDRLQAAVRDADPACVALAEAFAQSLGAAPGGEPLVEALHAVAALADRSGVANSFHNPAHSREVAIDWWLLARLHGSDLPHLSTAALLRGLIAAFGHDLDHDGQGNGRGDAYVPFRLEAIAAARVDAVMQATGAAAADRAAVAAMILCTDVRSGYPRLDGAAGADPRFAALADPAVLLAARMLRDADLMPSAGTSLGAYRARTAELTREGGLPDDPPGDAAAILFDTIMERRFLSPPAQLFAPRLRAIAAAAG